MPLLGKLEAGLLNDLLTFVQDSDVDTTLQVHSQQGKGELSISNGTITQFRHHHPNHVQILHELNQWQDGQFLVYRDDETPRSSQGQPLIWLIDGNPQRQEALASVLQNKGHSTAIIITPEELPQLLRSHSPKRLIIGAEFVKQHLLLLQQLIAQWPPECQLILIDELHPDLEVLQPTLLQWPQTSEQLEQTLRLRELTTSPKQYESQGVQSLAEHQNPQFDFINELFPTPSPESLTVKLARELPPLFQREGAGPWHQWFKSLRPLGQPLNEWLKKCPGTESVAHLLLHSCLQIGMLKLTRQTGVPQTRSISQPAQKGEAFSLTKLIVFGLRGKIKENWIESLQELSRVRSTQYPRKRTFPIPQLTKSEHARIPIGVNDLLVVYGAITKQGIDSLLEQIGTSKIGFLFFVDFSNPHEWSFVEPLRQQILTQYNVPNLIMAHTPQMQMDIAMLQNQLQISSEYIEPIEHFDQYTTKHIMDRMLQQLGRPQGI